MRVRVRVEKDNRKYSIVSMKQSIGIKVGINVNGQSIRVPTHHVLVMDSFMIC